MNTILGVSGRFDRLMRRYADGGGNAGTSASADTTTASGANADSSSTQAGEPIQQPTEKPAEPFKTFASQADFDREIQQYLKSREDSIKSKLTPEIKAQLEKEANMTAEQKVQAALEQIDADKKDLAKEKAKISTESLLVKAGIGEAERTTILDCCVTENAEQSAKNVQAVIDAIDKATKEQIKKAMADVKTPKTGIERHDEEDVSVTFAKERAEKRMEATKASNTALNYYINGGKKV